MLGVSIKSLHLYDEGVKYLEKALEFGKSYAKNVEEAHDNYVIKGELEKSITLLNESLEVMKKTFGENSK